MADACGELRQTLITRIEGMIHDVQRELHANNVQYETLDGLCFRGEQLVRQVTRLVTANVLDSSILFAYEKLKSKSKWCSYSCVLDDYASAGQLTQHTTISNFLQCMYFHFKSMRISFFLVKLQESTKVRQSRTIQDYVSPFWFCFLNFFPVDRAVISHMNRQQNSSR